MSLQKGFGRQGGHLISFSDFLCTRPDRSGHENVTHGPTKGGYKKGGMSVFRQILGRRPRDPQKGGLPRGRVMEVRAVVLVGLLILTGMVCWWGFYQLEKQVYMTGPKPERIPTAAGKPDQP